MMGSFWRWRRRGERVIKPQMQTADMLRAVQLGANQPLIVSKDVLTTEEAAQFLEVSVWTVRQMAHNAELPARKVGRAWRFSRQALLDWLGEEGSMR